MYILAYVFLFLSIAFLQVSFGLFHKDAIRKRDTLWIEAIKEEFLEEMN